MFSQDDGRLFLRLGIMLSMQITKTIERCTNGMMRDMSVLQEAPFTDHGSIVEVFTDLSIWMGIRRVIEQINSNALAA